MGLPRGRALLTHDVSTMSVRTFERIRMGQSIAALIEVPQSMPIGQAIEDILTIATCSTAKDPENPVQSLPL